MFPEIERILFVLADLRSPGNLAQARSLGASVSGLLSPDFSFLIGSQQGLRKMGPEQDSDSLIL